MYAKYPPAEQHTAGTPTRLMCLQQVNMTSELVSVMLAELVFSICVPLANNICTVSAAPASTARCSGDLSTGMMTSSPTTQFPCEYSHMLRFCMLMSVVVCRSCCTKALLPASQALHQQRAGAGALLSGGYPSSTYRNTTCRLGSSASKATLQWGAILDYKTPLVQ